jgi:hypothetical protein
MASKLPPSSKDAGFTTFRNACPLELKELPIGVCPLGLRRAQWMAENKGYLAHEEKTEAQGCKWGVLSEDHHSYCFFKLMDNYDGESFDVAKTAKYLNLEPEQVERITSSALLKLKSNPVVKELFELHRKHGDLFDNKRDNMDGGDYYVDEFDAEGAFEDGKVEDITESLKK